MTVLLTCAVVVPVLWLLVMVGEELIMAYRALVDMSAHGPYTVPGFIQRIPWLGEQLQQQVNRYSVEPAALLRQVGGWVKAWASELTAIAGGIGRNLVKLLVTIVTMFFLFLDGESIILQGRRVVRRFFDDRLDPYVATVATMTRSVVYGLVVTAFAQGLIAGIGYAIVGIEAAILLGALTGILSVVPMVGTGAVWASLSVYLALTGHIWKAMILLVWGVLLVHPTDNVLRPLLISNATRVPFLLVMFGVLGGLAAFGLVGAFVGPIILAVGLATWREWAAET
jgi:predicted PurR-regulated permease PerM